MPQPHTPAPAAASREQEGRDLRTRDLGSNFPWARRQVLRARDLGSNLP